jgi:hypothetical protein
MKRTTLVLTLVGILMLAATACSPVMEATRPTPVDVNQFALGESRTQIIGVVGSPISQIKDGDQFCDVYKLYTRGPGGVEKGAIAAGEAVADVFTLGLTEIIFTPVEAGTRNSKHTVTFCYDDAGKLVSMNDGGVNGAAD